MPVRCTALSRHTERTDRDVISSATTPSQEQSLSAVFRHVRLGSLGPDEESLLETYPDRAREQAGHDSHRKRVEDISKIIRFD